MTIHTKSPTGVSCGVGPSCHATASSAETPPTDSANLPGCQSKDGPGGFSPITAILETSPAVIDAQEAYDTVQDAYNAALMRCQTGKVREILPALQTARFRLIAARLKAEGVAV